MRRHRDVPGGPAGEHAQARPRGAARGAVQQQGGELLGPRGARAALGAQGGLYMLLGTPRADGCIRAHVAPLVGPRWRSAGRDGPGDDQHRDVEYVLVCGVLCYRGGRPVMDVVTI